MIVVDTDILIDHFHDNVAATNFVRSTLLSGTSLVISIATLAEIMAGMRPGEEDATESLLSLFQVYPADDAIARKAGAYLNQFAKLQRFDLGDALIAATAYTVGAVLFTRNVRHYPMTDITVKVPYERGYTSTSTK